MVRYDRLWITMKKKGITQYKLIKDYGFSSGQLSRLRKNQSVITYTIGTLCKILKCKVEEIMEYVEEDCDISQ